MKSQTSRPANARVINDYAMLLQYVAGFFVKFNLLILIGPPGTQKSRVVREALGTDKVLFLEGRVTPFQAYIELYRNRDFLVCIDDTEGLCSDGGGVVVVLGGRVGGRGNASLGHGVRVRTGGRAGVVAGDGVVVGLLCVAKINEVNSADPDPLL